MLNALSMTVGRGPVARAVADLAELTAGDQVIDMGCGPGAAARLAASRCAHATGVDPSPAMLRLGRWLNALRGTRNVTLVHGSAETIPLPDRSGTVLWALRSVHHWSDRAAGLAEAFRVLVPGGRLLLAERVVRPGAHGGLTGDQAYQLASEVKA
jgi:ubiquinone/menaquinone biosynthesis C-methylase UbiE